LPWQRARVGTIAAFRPSGLPAFRPSGVEASYALFEYKTPDGTLSGFDIDIDIDIGTPCARS